MPLLPYFKPMDENKPALYTPEQRAQLVKQMSEGMNDVPFDKIFKTALHTLHKKGIAAFFKNPKEFVADTIVTLAEDGALPPPPPAPETETKILQINPTTETDARS